MEWLWEWLWLGVALLGLAAMWLIIRGIEKLVIRMKNRDDVRQAASDRLTKRIAQEETTFLRKQAAKEYLLQPHLESKVGDPVPQEFTEAVNALSSDELVDTMVQKVFGDTKDTQGITATQSAFAQTAPAKTVVASGGGVLPVKTKAATDKTGLSKAEQKMLKKIKQGS